MKKKARFEATRQAALKEAAAADIERLGGCQDRNGTETPSAGAAGRGRGYDRLTIFPIGDKELEMSNVERVPANELAVSDGLNSADAENI